MAAKDDPKLLRDMTEPELSDCLVALARLVEAMLPPGPSAKGKCLFALIVTDSVGPGIGQYISNVQRGGMTELLRETANRIERNEDVRRDT